MSETLREWMVVWSFFLVIAGITFAEAAWLNRKGWAGFGKSLGFSLITNVIGFSGGFFVLFVVFGVVLAMAWDGSLKNFPMRDYGLGAALILAVLFCPALLTVCKRFFLSILKMQTGKSAWLFSLVSSLLSLTVSIGIPILLGYILLR